MTSQTSSTPEEDPRGESLTQDRVDELKEAYIEGDLTEAEFDELLDSCFSDGPPYWADSLLSNRRTKEVPTPEEMDEHVVQYKGEYYTIDGNIARVRDEVPDWENVINVTGNGDGPDEDKITRIERDDGPTSEDVKQKQAELRREILGR